MRKLVLQTSMSIDGYVAALDGSHPWGGKQDDAQDDWFIEKPTDAGAHLMGRVTYEEMASHWPNSEGRFAAVMNNIPKVVFSKTLTTADWPETTIASGDLADEIARLKAQPGGDLIAYGGATFDQALSQAGVVDEYRLMVNATALGAGMPVFKDLAGPLQLELVEAQEFATGAVGRVYRPRR